MGLSPPSEPRRPNVQLVKKLDFYRIRLFFTEFTKANHWTV